HLVERSVQSIEADTAASRSLVRQVRRQRRAIFEVSKVVDADQRSNRLAMLADGHGAVPLPGLGHEFTQDRGLVAHLPTSAENCASPSACTTPSHATTGDLLNVAKALWSG